MKTSASILVPRVLGLFAASFVMVMGQSADVLPPVSGSNPEAEFRDPIWVPVKFGASFNAIGTMSVALGGVGVTATNFTAICGGGWVPTPQAETYLMTYRSYTLNAWGTNAYGIDIEIIPPTVNDLLKGRGRNAHQFNRYRIYVKDPLTQEFVRLEDYGSLGWNCEGGFCRSVSLAWEIEVRPVKGARPLSQPGPKKLGGDDQGDDSWSRDEDPVSGAAAPGDGVPLSMRAAKNGDPSSAVIKWEGLLGRLWNGDSAGRIRYTASRLSTDAYKPTALYYSPRSYNSNELEVVVLTNNANQIYQVKAPQTFLRVNTLSTNSFELIFYPRSAAGSKDTNGYYTLVQGSSPLVRWRFDSPDGSTNQIRVTEIRGVWTNESRAAYTTAGSYVWTLTSGTGSEARTETRTIVTNTVGGQTYRRETQQIKNGLNLISDLTVEVYQKFPWGYELRWTTNDPGGLNLVTEYDYFANAVDDHNFKRLAYIQYPDGFWERREYSQGPGAEPGNPRGALDRIVHPWKDSPRTAPNDDCLVTQFAYTDLATGSFNLQKFHDRPSYPDNSPASVVYEEQTHFDEDWDTELELRQFGDLEHYGERYEYRTYTEYMGNVAGQLYSRTAQTGWRDSYDYAAGNYNPLTYAFSVSPIGSDWKKVVYHGTSAPDTAGDSQISLGESGYGIDPVYLTPNKSLKEVFILASGSLAAKETWVFKGAGQFDLLERLVYARDTLGHATNITRIDPKSSPGRTMYTADWKGGNTLDGDLKWSETDEAGIEHTYAYDSLQRIVSKTRKGLPGGEDVIESFVYDAANRLRTNATSAGGLSLSTVITYDRAGRITSQRTPDGLTTSTGYASGGLVITNTLPGLSVNVVTNFLDRRPASVTGNAQVHQFFDYTLTGEADGDSLHPKNVTTTTLGSVTSPRWTQSITDNRFKPAQERRPGFRSTNDVVTTYDANQFGLLRGVYESGFEQPLGGLTPEVRTIIQHNRYEEKTLEGLSVTGGGYSTNSLDRLCTWRTYYETNASGHWFKVTDQFGYLTDNNGAQTLLRRVKERQSGFTSTDVSEVISYDPNLNATSVKVTVDRPNKTLTTTTDVPESTNNAVRVNVNGLLQTETTPSVASPLSHHYDPLGREIAVTDPLGFMTGTRYDPVTGQVTATTNQLGLVTTYSYYPSGTTNAGKLYSQTDPTGRKSYFNYSPRGEPNRQWGDVPHPELREYSEFGELIRLTTYQTGTQWTATNWPATPPAGTVTQWFYDGPTGLLTNKTDAAGRSVTYSYYNNQLPRTRTWARPGNVTATNLYSNIKDLIGIDYSDSTPDVVYGNHDRRGLPRSVSDARGARALAYDAFGRMTSDNGTSGDFNGINLVSHFHAYYGRDYLQVQIPGQSTIQNDFGYDGYGRLGSASYNGYSANYGYLANSDLWQSTIFKIGSTPKLTTSRTWEYGFRLGAVDNVAASRVSSHNYAYDQLDRRIRATLADGSAWHYDYNDRDELISGRRTWPDFAPVTGQQYEYSYDHIGNRLSAASGGDTNGANLRATAYVPNSLNQYSTITTPGYEDILGVAWATNTVTVNGGATDRKAEYYHREISLSNSGGPVWQAITLNPTPPSGTATNLLFPKYSQTLSYDLDGNLTFDGIWTYAWDAENRLREMAITNVTGIAHNQRKKLAFAYDHLGRRVTKIVSTWNGSMFTTPVTNKFVHDGWNLVVELNGSNVPQRSYLWGMDLSGDLEGAGGIGGLATVRDHTGGTYNFPAYDGNGNVTALVDAANQSVAAQYEYSPFGETLRATGTLAKANPFRFSTKFADEESGLLYYGRRYYSPTLGRWINRDPIEEEGGINLYAFCRNNSLTSFDPDGRWTVPEIMLAVGPSLEVRTMSAMVYARAYGAALANAAGTFGAFVAWTGIRAGSTAITIGAQSWLVANAYVRVAASTLSEISSAAYRQTWVTLASPQGQQFLSNMTAGIMSYFGAPNVAKQPGDNLTSAAGQIMRSIKEGEFDAFLDFWASPDEKME